MIDRLCAIINAGRSAMSNTLLAAKRVNLTALPRSFLPPSAQLGDPHNAHTHFPPLLEGAVNGNSWELFILSDLTISYLGNY